MVSDPLPRSRWPLVFLCLVVATAAVIGLSLLGLSLVSTDAVKAAIDRASPDGKAWTFPIERVEAILARARVLGTVYLAAGGAACVGFRRRGAWVGALGAAARMLLASMRLTLREFVRERAHAGWLLLATLVGLALRVSILDQDMRSDESTTTLVFAARPLVYGVSDYAAPNNHLLNTVLIHASLKLFGTSPEAVRLPALLFGTLLVPGTYGAVRSIANKHAALLAAVLVACSPYLVYYSANGRAYMLVALAFMLLISLSAYLMRATNRAAWVLIVVVGALGFFGIPTMLFPFGICMAWLFLDAVLRRQEVSLVDRVVALVATGTGTIALTAVFYTPVLLISGPASLFSNKFVVPMTAEVFAREIQSRTAEFLDGALMSMTVPAIVAMATGIVLSAVFHRSVGRQKVPLLVATVLWCVTLLVVQRAAPYGRVWTFLHPLLIGLASIGLFELGRRFLAPRFTERASAIATAVLTALLALPITVHQVMTDSASSFWDSGRCPDAVPAAEYAKGHLAPGERVLSTHPAHPILAYYFRSVGMPKTMTSSEPGGPPYSMVFMDCTLAEFNERLAYGNKPPIASSQLTLVRRFQAASLYRLDHPLPP